MAALYAQTRVELTILDTVAIVGIHNENHALGAGVVMAPQRTDLST